MRRRIKMAAAFIVALAIAATGTFAWHRVVSKANEFIGKTTDVTLHDDFDPDTNLKDIYVENTGNVTLFVRMKLKEAMNLTNNTWRPSGSSDWATHVYGSAADNCGLSNSAGKPYHDYFKWHMGGQKFYKPGNGSQGIAQDKNIYNGTEPGVKTTPVAQIITATQFLAMAQAAQKNLEGWIYDVDGYAYWSKPLQPGDVTGLLLHGVETLPSLKGTEYYYVINAIVETVDINDIPMWTQGAQSVDKTGATLPMASQDGKAVLAIITK